MKIGIIFVISTFNREKHIFLKDQSKIKIKQQYTVFKRNNNIHSIQKKPFNIYIVDTHHTE